jgi:hypothetical protein
MRVKCLSYQVLNLLNVSVTLYDTSLLFIGDSYPRVFIFVNI